MYRIKYSSNTVQKAINDIAEKVHITDNSYLLILMNGGMWFAHELIRRFLTPPPFVNVIKISSRVGKEQSDLKIEYLPLMNLEGKDVIVVDDICDSGITLNAISDWLAEQHSASQTFVTLIKRKGGHLREDINLITGIVDDSGDFFVGCGMDNNGKDRYLPYLGVIDC